VISAAFIFRPGTYDDEFHRLNKLIDAAAKATEGFLGSETWKSFDQALKEFSGNANHLEAKKQYSRWYDGYHIVVSEVIRSYGDDVIQHLTPNDRAG
jgi:hypothetical protein